MTLADLADLAPLAVDPTFWKGFTVGVAVGLGGYVAQRLAARRRARTASRRSALAAVQTLIALIDNAGAYRPDLNNSDRIAARGIFIGLRVSLDDYCQHDSDRQHADDLRRAAYAVEDSLRGDSITAALAAAITLRDML